MNRISRKLPTILISVILALSTMATFAALPYFRFGVWQDAEPTVVAVFSLGGLVWLWSGFRLWKDKTVCLPNTIMVAMGLALWSLLVSFAAPYPFLSIVGSPQLAEGAALFFCFSGFMLAAFLSRDNLWGIRMAMLAALLLIVYAVIVDPLPISSPYKLFFFPDYLGVFAVLVPLIVYLFVKTFNLSSQKLMITTLLAFAGAALVAYLGDNRGAVMIVFVLGLGGWGVCSLVQRYMKPVYMQRVMVLACLAIVVVPLAIHALIFWVGADYQAETTGELTLFYSLWSRSLMFDLNLEAMKAGGLGSYLFGNGFGHSVIAIQNFLPFSDQDFVNPTWDTFSRDYVHTHSIPFETFVSGGGLALVLYLGVFILWIIEAAPKYKVMVIAVALSYVAIVSLWFQFATVVPLIGVLVGLTLTTKDQKAAKVGARKAVLWAAPLVAISLLYLAYWIYAHAQSHDKDIFVERAAPESAAIKDDGLRGHVAFHRALRQGYKAVVEGEDLSPLDYAWVNRLVERARQDLSDDPSSSLVLEYILMASDFAYIMKEDQRYLTLRDNTLEDWSLAASLLIKKAPHRIDVLIPYFTFYFSDQVTPEQRSWAEVILDDFYEQFPLNPIALWFRGQQKLLIAKTVDQSIDALEHLLVSVEMFGLRRFMDIPADAVRELQKTRGILRQHKNSDN